MPGVWSGRPRFLHSEGAADSDILGWHSAAPNLPKSIKIVLYLYTDSLQKANKIKLTFTLIVLGNENIKEGKVFCVKLTETVI